MSDIMKLWWGKICMNFRRSQFQYFPSKIFQAGIIWTMPITQTGRRWVSHDDILSKKKLSQETFPKKLFLTKCKRNSISTCIAYYAYYAWLTTSPHHNSFLKMRKTLIKIKFHFSWVLIKWVTRCNILNQLGCYWLVCDEIGSFVNINGWCEIGHQHIVNHWCVKFHYV